MKPAVFPALIVLVWTFMACSKGGDGVAGSDVEKVALEFVQALGNREYAQAHALTTRDFQERNTVVSLQNSFEAIVPLDWGPMEPIEVGETMADWPGKKPGDLGWVYVSIGGDVYSEAVIVIVAQEGGATKIREVEYGRP